MTYLGLGDIHDIEALISYLDRLCLLIPRLIPELEMLLVGDSVSACSAVGCPESSAATWSGFHHNQRIT